MTVQRMHCSSPRGEPRIGFQSCSQLYARRRRIVSRARRPITIPTEGDEGGATCRNPAARSPLPHRSSSSAPSRAAPFERRAHAATSCARRTSRTSESADRSPSTRWARSRGRRKSNTFLRSSMTSSFSFFPLHTDDRRPTSTITSANGTPESGLRASKSYTTDSDCVASRFLLFHSRFCAFLCM
jgi:hypothetical protein